MVECQLFATLWRSVELRDSSRFVQQIPITGQYPPIISLSFFGKNGDYLGLSGVASFATLWDN